MGFELQKFDCRKVSKGDVTASVRKSTPHLVSFRIGGATRIRVGFKGKIYLLPYVDAVTGECMLARAEKHQENHPSARRANKKSGNSIYVDFPINDTLREFFTEVSVFELEVCSSSVDKLVVKLPARKVVKHG